MINLPNGCGCSNLSVHPKNWKSRSAKMSQDWYITYRFYDPRYPKPKLVMVKGMNHFKVLSERQQATENILQKEMDKLLNDGFNPCHNAKTLVIPVGHLNKDMGILDALNTVANTLDVSAYTKRDLRSMLKTVGKAIVNLGLGKYCISQVTRKIIKMILEKSSNSSDRFNKNRSYLLILFSELCELEIIENNPVRDIRKKKIVKRIRQVLSTSERQMVDTHLRENYPEFHQFLNIFFHSGLRISE
ncbi:MAG TPA: hypothetical protein P5158_12085, partial [Chitinophagaceae bacterium]|nr:hypothetical protein [Chitinophagaceae bacterium]